MARPGACIALEGLVLRALHRALNTFKSRAGYGYAKSFGRIPSHIGLSLAGPTISFSTRQEVFSIS